MRSTALAILHSTAPVLHLFYHFIIMLLSVRKSLVIALRHRPTLTANTKLFF